MPMFSQINLLGFLVYPVIAGTFFLLGLPDQLRRNFIDPAVEFRAFLSGTGDDQRGARLVNQDRIHLIHQRVMQRPLHLLIQREGHIVAQIVKAVFVISAVGDVGMVGGAFFIGTHPGNDHADAHSQKPVNLPHPVGVALRQIVIDRDHMNAFAGQCVEINRQGRH